MGCDILLCVKRIIHLELRKRGGRYIYRERGGREKKSLIHTFPSIFILAVHLCPLSFSFACKYTPTYLELGWRDENPLTPLISSSLSKEVGSVGKFVCLYICMYGKGKHELKYSCRFLLYLT